MKQKPRKYSYLILIIAIISNMVFIKDVSSHINLFQESISNNSSSSGQFSIPSCTQCEIESKPTCLGAQSPLCSVTGGEATCQLIGNICSSVCPDANFAAPNLPFCSTKYFFIDGDGSGIQIYSGADSPLKIPMTINSTTIADGIINEPNSDCNGSNLHFNGTISNFSDPDPTGCGWGHVVTFKELSERLSLISDIITSTQRASYKTQALAAVDFGAALVFVNSSSNKLKELKNLINKSKEFKSAKKKSLLRKIELILKTNEVAKLNLTSLLDAQNPTYTADVDPYKRDAAITALSKAHDDEIAIFKILLKSESIQ